MTTNRFEGKRILIVDDDREMVEFYSSALAPRGYVINKTYSGGEALEFLAKEKANLVLLDYSMPIMSGLETLDRIKSVSPDVETIMISGQGDVQTAVEAMKKGAADFLQKPVKVEDLLSLIEKRLDIQQVKSLIVLYETSQQVFSAININYMLEAVIAYFVSIFQADECAIFLRNCEGRYAMEVGRNLKSPSVDFCEEVSQKISKFSPAHPRSFLFNQGVPFYSEFSILLSKPSLSSSIVAALVDNEVVLGCLYLARAHNKKQYSCDDLQNLSHLSSQITNILKNASLHSEIEQKVVDLKDAQNEIKEVRSALLEKEKFAKLGIMASEVAHEINNPLSAVVGYVDLILQESVIENEVKEQLGIVFREAQRCSGMIDDLLNYSRFKEPRTKPANLDEVVRETLEVLALDLEKYGVTVELNADKNIPEIEIDAGQIKQVFLNLIKNACHALQERVFDRKIVFQSQLAGTDQVEITVSDNGPGISDEILNNIFTPFVSTKASSNKGTGLGLSISKRIIEEHGGRISVLSKKNEGTSFKITLPLKQSSKPSLKFRLQ